MGGKKFMKKQKIRFYAALLCSSMVFSLVSTPVSAAETGQLTNPPTSTEGPGSPESASGNEAAAMLNGLYAALPVANGVKEVATAEELTAALADSSISGITLKGDIDIGSTLTVNRTVTLDLNGNVLKMTGRGSVIKVESGGNLTIADSNASTPHNFNPDYKDSAWHIDMWKLDDSGLETVSGGVITGGSSDYAHNDGGGVLVNAGGTLTMTGGSIVGCSAIGLGGGVRLAYDSAIGKNSTFTMTGGSIIGCAAKNGGGVSVSPGCTFTMGPGSEIRNCNAQSGGGGVGISALWNSNIIGRFIMNGGTIRTCTGLYSGGVDNSGSFIMSGGTIKASISTTTQYASSGGVRNDNQFTMTGGTIGDPDNENDASHVYNTSSQETTLTISGNAKIYTNVTNVGILNADGGGIAGTMTNDTNRYGTGTITGSEGAADSTEFQGKVTNNGTIRKGTFTSEVINESSGTINGGTFTGTVENKDGTISGGDFSKATLNGMLVITFEPNNGEPVITREVNWSKDGVALTAPDPVPTKEGHSLDGWYYDNNGTETKWNFDTDTVKCTMTLKAKWELSTYSVTLQMNGGTIASGKEVTGYTYGTGAVLPTADDITREGYRFDGWYADSSFSGSPVTEITGTDTGDKVFYAKWMRNTTPIVPGNNTSNIVEQYKTDDSSSGEQTDREVPSPVVKNTSYMTYTVQVGDTLWAIARKYNCSITEIMAANSDRIKNPNRIHAGWQLKIPQSGAPITGGTPDAVLPENKKSGIYIVRQGDTLWKIARKYGCSVAEIISLNRELIRNPALIYSGWELKVPQN
ncbi:LysM peptidoglycan-binding domain-containing protein [Firmicutes bacterium AF22-6AC]|nr:LysM peptidoglycan-binding domain-containing protein [Firmicutes bacterium AF22-6AC]